jgi:hypothetical protein
LELVGCHSKVLASGVDAHNTGGDAGGSVITVPLCPSLAEVNWLGVWMPKSVSWAV